MKNFDGKDFQKIVIKIGSSLLTNTKGGVNKTMLKNLVADINWLLDKRKNIIVVSSGAISLGKGKLNIKNDLTLNQSQAVAARGQIELMTAWKNEFKKYKKQVAQILLTPADIKNKKSSKNAIATIENLMEFKCIPIINENDTTATDEIKFGDNDILTAQIATLIGADHLILLSNVDGLYKEPPKNKKNEWQKKNSLQGDWATGWLARLVQPLNVASKMQQHLKKIQLGFKTERKQARKRILDKPTRILCAASRGGRK